MNDEEYCCTGHIVGWMGTQTGGDLKCSDPERVRCPRVAPPHSAPNSLTSPTFGQAPSSDKQRRPRSIYWACRKTLSALAHVAQWWHSTNTITPACTNRNISGKLTEMRSLIHKMFSEAVISPAGLSLNSYEWDHTFCDLQYMMVQKENSREKKQAVENSRQCLHVVVLLKSPESEGGCLILLSWTDNTFRAYTLILEVLCRISGI